MPRVAREMGIEEQRIFHMNLEEQRNFQGVLSFLASQGKRDPKFINNFHDLPKVSFTLPALTTLPLSSPKHTQTLSEAVKHTLYDATV